MMPSGRRICYITASLLVILVIFSHSVAKGQIALNFSVPEEQSGIIVGRIQVGNGFTLLTSTDYFNISNDGVIMTVKKIDREKEISKIPFTLIISSTSSTAYQVSVYILDINDNTPSFPSPKITHRVSESSQIGHKISLAPATDADSGNNGSLVYQIVSGNIDDRFKIRYVNDTNSLDLIVDKVLDRETVPSYALNITACDQGIPKLCGFCMAEITLQDVNDNAPLFSPTRYSGNITENSETGLSILKVNATDIDLGSNAKITFTVEQSSNAFFYFSSKDKGVLMNSISFDYERKKEYKVVVRATDSGANRLSSIAHVKINVLDANDNSPQFFITFYNPGSYQVNEGAPIDSQIALITVRDPDSGLNGDCDVMLESGNEYFVIKKSSSIEKSYVLHVGSIIDREQTPQIRIRLNATDKGHPPRTTKQEYTINIGDVNDNAPVFSNGSYFAKANESTPHTQSLLQVSATDKDLGSNKEITYSIVNNSIYSSWFRIDANSGNIYTTRLIDRETQTSVSITVNAKDNGTPSKDSNVQVFFDILDANDNPPMFNKPKYVFSAAENTTRTQILGLVAATDPDTAIFLPIRYSLLGTSYFQINANTGEIRTSHVFDRELKATETLTVVATDIGGLQNSAVVEVKILDINDNEPYFPKTFYNITVYENTPVGIPIQHITAKDDDIGENGRVVYQLHSCQPCNTFKINNETGGLSPLVILNHFLQSIYHFTVSCHDAKGLPGRNRATVTVHVLKVVRKVPKFGKDEYAFNFAENMAVGSFVGKVVARRDGVNVEELLDYKFLSVELSSSFSINYTGGIYSKKVIDFEKTKQFTSVVTVKVFGTNLTASTSVQISITDVNDNTPYFNSSQVTIHLNESVPLGFYVFRAAAVDIDSANNGIVIYSFTNPSSYFRIDARTGIISTKSLIDYEVLKEVNIVIIAEDKGTPKRNSTLSLKVLIVDINDNPPQFPLSSYFTSISEDAVVGTLVIKLNVTDADSGANGEFSLAFKEASYTDVFTLSNDGKVKVAKQLDRESKTDYAFTVIAKDKGFPQQTTQVRLTIIVNDVNDNGPLFGTKSVLLSVCEEKPPGTYVKAVTATDNDEGSNGLISYQFQPPSQYFDINSVTGVIETKVKFDRETSRQIYNLFVNATDGGSPAKSSLLEVKINICDTNDHTPVFTKEAPYILSILKSTSQSTSILHVQATDKDQGLASIVEYSLVSMFDKDDSLSRFEIEKNSGWIKTKQSLSSSTRTVYKLSVVAKDKGLPRMVNIQKVIIFLLPGNGQPSLFPTYDKTLILPESTSVDSTLYTARIANEHLVQGRLWEYSLASGNSAGYFKINKSSGEIKLASVVSYRVTPSFQLKIQVADRNQQDTRTGFMYVNIFVQSINREWPVFKKNPMISGQNENVAPWGFSFVANAIDNDFEDNGKLLFSIVSQGPGTPSFDIDPFTGRITNTALLDREKVSEWTLIIKAQDTAINASARHSTTATMKLIIFDLNDNRPKFLSSNYTYMMEDERVGYPVMRVVASDADQGNNARVNYFLRAGNERGKFQIQPSTGQITLKEKLSYNEKSSYSLTIDAVDSGAPSLTASQVLTVEIIDVNNNGPRFTQRSFIGNITENKPVGTRVLQVTATDLDAGSNAQIVYRLEANSHFEIDSTTGWISSKGKIDREEWASYKLGISADNTVWPFHSDTAVVIINVDDINDCPPVFSDGPFINVTVFENSKTVVHRFVASDCDIEANAKIQYRIVEGDTKKFSLDANSGYLETAALLDREVTPVYEIKVQARNVAPPHQSVLQTAKILVNDLNDNNPIFTKQVYLANVSENSPLNSTVLQVTARDADEGSNGKVVYEVVRNSTLIPFEVNSDTGAVFVNGHLDYEGTKRYQFIVTAADIVPYGKKVKALVVINIIDYNDNAPIFTSPIFEGNTTDSIIVHATDIDSGVNGRVRYRFTSGNSMFSVDSLTGKVSFQNPTVGRYTLKIEAYDLGTPQRSSTTTLIINVGSYSVLIPKFMNKSASARIPENSAENVEVCKMVASSSSSNVRYAIESNDNTGAIKPAFRIDPVTGIVYVNNPVLLDYERTKSFDVVIQASINGNDTLSTYAKLRINLTDMNDNAPEIDPRNHHFSFLEASPGENQSEHFIRQFSATDADSGANGRIEELTISGGNEDGVFRMGPYGILVLAKNLDYEKKKIYKLEIKARDGGSPPKYKTTRFTVNVIDTNDNPPVFKNEGPKRISEDASKGSLIGIVEATDPDKISQKSIKYSLKNDGISEQYFYIDPTKGSITLLRKLDYETKKQFRIVVEANDGKYRSNMTLTIDVIDTNDNTPVFTKPGYDVYLPETVPVNYQIIRLNATDRDSGKFGKVYYSIAYSPIDAFLINQTSGIITATKRILLNARKPPYKLLVTASDGGNPPLQTQTRIHLRVKDPNYAGPQFDPRVYPKTRRIFESIPVKALIETVTVMQSSNPPGMTVEYSLQGGNEDGKFYIDPLNGKIQSAALLDRENVSTYSLVVRATDRGTPPQFAEAVVKVILVDTNDNRPVFEKEEYFVTVREDIALHTVLVRVNATDRDDPNPQIGNGLIDKYTITSGNSLNWFDIDSNGVITLIRLLDRESTPIHRLTVTATDKGHQPLTGDTSVVIKLKDVNDNRPELPIPNIEDLKVSENSENGTLVFKATAEDRDQGLNGLVTYSIVAGDGKDYFRIDNETGWVRTKGNNLDYERQRFYVLTIMAADHGSPPQQSTQEYRIAVQDVNEYWPQFVKQKYEFSVKGNASVGTRIGTVIATDKDGGSWSKVRYSIDRDELKIGPDTGDIFVNSDLRKRKEEKRKRRSTDSGILSFLIKADNGPNTTAHTVPMVLEVDYSCLGCVYIVKKNVGDDSSLKGVPLILVTVFATAIALLLLCLLVFLWRQRRNQGRADKEEENETKPDPVIVRNEQPVSPEHDFDQTDNFNGYHPRIFKQPSIGTSSGHGSSGSQLLGEYRRPSFTATDIESTHSFVVYHDNKPVLDSGIVGDIDRLSDVTISDIAPSTDIPYVHKAEVASSVGSSFGRRNEVHSSLSRKLKQGLEYSTQSDSHDSLNDFMDEGGGEAAGRIEFGNLLYTKLSEVDADEHEAVMDGTRSFMDEGVPSRGASLSTIIGSDEEMKGNYSRDYLLDWGPQFKPVASVFSEIAEVKRSEATEKSLSLPNRGAAMLNKPPIERELSANITAQTIPHNKHHMSDIEASQSIPMQNLAKKRSLRHSESLNSRADSVKPNYNGELNNTNFISNRTSMLSSFASLPRSPLSAQSSYTSGPLSPNFTPAITPLITRSPSVSPLETPSVASPMDSKAESVLDVAEKTHKSKRSSRRSEKITLSDRGSEQEYRV